MESSGFTLQEVGSIYAEVSDIVGMASVVKEMLSTSLAYSELKCDIKNSK